ncbi:MAG: hypothetical protein ACFHWZ_05115 [Phycisphaerales bacterium]
MWGFVALLGLGLVIALALGAWITGHHLRRPPRKTYGWALRETFPAIRVNWTSHSRLMRSNWICADDPELKGFGLSPVWDVEGRDPSGPVIIWTPGWGDSRVGALARIRHLAPVAKRVIAWDPPGQGEASGRWPMAVREDRMLMQLAQWATREHAGALVLAGSSMGAGLSIVSAVRLAEAEGVKVVGVIAEAPYRRPTAPARNYLRATGHPHSWNIQSVYALMGVRLGAGWDWSKRTTGAGSTGERGRRNCAARCWCSTATGT